MERFNVRCCHVSIWTAVCQSKKEGITVTRISQGSHDQANDAGDFSLVLGGPLFQLFRRAHLAGDGLELLRRRIVVIALVAWLPLLLLSVTQGTVVGSAVAVPFLFDIDVHVRFLIALPLLIAAELVVHERMRAVVAQFVSQGLVPATVRARFDAALENALQLRDSAVAEVLIIIFVYTVLVLGVWRYIAVDVPTWYAVPEAGSLRPQLAGWWYLFVSIPVFQFILLRWYFRLCIWARFLWQVSQLPLAYAPMHPDRMAGIGFLPRVTHAFAPLMFAQGALLAGAMANKILFGGAVLTAFTLEIAAVVTVVVLVILAPLLVFALPLAAVKRTALREYGHLARRYVDEFDDKWLRGRAARDEPLVGSADIQSLADLGNSFEVVTGMRTVPITRDSVVQLLAMTLLPLAPLLLTIFSLEELLKRFLTIVF